MKVIYFKLIMITKLLLLLPFNNKYTEIKNCINVTDSYVANYIKLVKLRLWQNPGFGKIGTSLPFYDIFFLPGIAISNSKILSCLIQYSLLIICIQEINF